MLKNELHSICSFYAISPIHAGSGSSLAAIDLPIQRERHTNWPHIQASAVKGAMRAHYRNFSNDNNINYIFGGDSQDDWKESENAAGSVSFSDAKLIAFPVRSNIAPFVWVTCPAVLKRLKSDLEFAQINSPDMVIPAKESEAFALFDSVNQNDKVILEDAVVKIADIKKNGIEFISEKFPQIDKLLIISDDMFNYCVTSCTEVQTQIKIDSDKGTAKDGSLRYQELLPADSLLYSVVYYSASAFENSLQAENVKKYIQEVIKGFMQIGGDETLGRGICRINWIEGGAK